MYNNINKQMYAIECNQDMSYILHSVRQDMYVLHVKQVYMILCLLVLAVANWQNTTINKMRDIINYHSESTDLFVETIYSSKFLESRTNFIKFVGQI